MMCRYSPGAFEAWDEHSYAITIDICVHRQMSEVDLLVIASQDLKSASKNPTTGLSTEESSDIVRIFSRRQ